MRGGHCVVLDLYSLFMFAVWKCNRLVTTGTNLADRSDRCGSTHLHALLHTRRSGGNVMLMPEPLRDIRDPGGRVCRGERSSSLLKVLRRERRAAAAVEEARGCSYDSIDDYQTQISRLGACITNLEGMGMESSVAGRDWVARAALRACPPSDGVDATTAAAIRAVRDAATSARPLVVADARTMAPSARSGAVAAREAARHKAQAMRDEATAMAAAAAAAAAAEAMAEAGSRAKQVELSQAAARVTLVEARAMLPEDDRYYAWSRTAVRVEGEQQGREMQRQAAEVRLEAQAVVAWAAAKQAEARAARAEARAAHLEARLDARLDAQVGASIAAGALGAVAADVQRRLLRAQAMAARASLDAHASDGCYAHCASHGISCGDGVSCGISCRILSIGRGEGARQGWGERGSECGGEGKALTPLQSVARKLAWEEWEEVSPVGIVTRAGVTPCEVEARSSTRGASCIHHDLDGTDFTALTGRHAGASSQCVLPTAISATPTACMARGGSLEGSRRSPAMSPPLPPPPPPLSSAPTEPPSTSTASPSTPPSSAPPSAPAGHRPSAPSRAAANSEARPVIVATPRASHDTSQALLAACQGGVVLGERATALLARRAAASRVAAAAIALAALATRTPLSERAGPREVDTSAAAATTHASVTSEPLPPLPLPGDLLVAAVTAPTALLAARAAAAAPRSVAEAAHTAAVLRCAKLLEGARGSEAAGARGCEATLGRRDGRASDRSDPWIQRGGHFTATATAMAGSRGRGGWSHPRESVPGAARSKQQTQQRVQQRAQAPRAARVVRSGRSFFPYNHGPGKLRGEAAPFMPPRLKPGSATSTASATSAASTASATSAASAASATKPPNESAEGKCRPGSPLPYRWPGRPMTPPVE